MACKRHLSSTNTRRHTSYLNDRASPGALSSRLQHLLGATDLYALERRAQKLPRSLPHKRDQVCVLAVNVSLPSACTCDRASSGREQNRSTHK